MANVEVGTWVVANEGWRGLVLSYNISGPVYEVAKNGSFNDIHFMSREDFRIPRKKTTVVDAYNDMMYEVGFEGSTIGTPDAESTDRWNLADMVAEARYILSVYVNHEGPCSLMEHDAPAEYRKHIKMLTAFIKKYSAKAASMHCRDCH